MAVVVIGGQASGVGKTSLICALIRAMPERRWTAIKITQCDHAGAKPCDCSLGNELFAITEELTPGAETDTARYLAAGAERAFWVRTRREMLSQAWPVIRDTIAAAKNVVLESNAAMEFLDPALYAMVISPAIEDFKPSALRWLDQAHALVMQGAASGPAPSWQPEFEERTSTALRFQMTLGEPLPEKLVEYVRARIA